jgi:hypothetical protein
MVPVAASEPPLFGAFADAGSSVFAAVQRHTGRGHRDRTTLILVATLRAERTRSRTRFAPRCCGSGKQ